MTVTLYGLVMAFGALVASIGLVLLFRKHEESQSRIRLFGQEFQFSAPGLVVTLAGCALVVLLPVLQVSDKPVFTIGSGSSDGIHSDGATDAKGPHHSFTTAYPIKLESSTKGGITVTTDRDFFKFQVPTSLSGVPKIRVIVEKLFWARATVYDSNEQSVSSGSSYSEDPVSFSFESTPGAYYYIMVEGDSGGRGEYTLIVRQQ